MANFRRNLIVVVFTLLYSLNSYAIIIELCNEREKVLNLEEFDILFNATVPELNYNKRKGQAGKIGVIGGSIEYTGAPYFAAITSLKLGADLVTVITTESAAPVIKSYSPELIVYPYLSEIWAAKIPMILEKLDIIIIGPGLGKDKSIMRMVSDIMLICRTLKKPLVVDADGLYLISKNLTLIENYPPPGAVLLPNEIERVRIQEVMTKAGKTGFQDLGIHTYVLIKGHYDTFVSSILNYRWSSNSGGSGRRAGGQGDILAGAVGTFFNWGLKSNICENEMTSNIAASVATFKAAKLTRLCNEKAFQLFGRSMLASDMLTQIHVALKDLHVSN